MNKVEITYEDLKELLRTAQMRGTEHHWPAIALQFAEEALKEIARLRALLQADEPKASHQSADFEIYGNGAVRVNLDGLVNNQRVREQFDAASKIVSRSQADEKEEPGRWGDYTQDVLYDSAWMAGAMFGWNCGVADNRPLLNAAINSRVRARKEITAALRSREEG